VKYNETFFSSLYRRNVLPLQHKNNKKLKNMKKSFIAFLVFMSINSVMQTTHADTPITLDNGNPSNHGIRRAPKKITSLFEVCLDEDCKTLKFYASSEEQIVVVIFNDKGMYVQDDMLDIAPNTESIINLKSLDKGEYVIRVYNKGVESKGTFTIQ
jgi:hypothetical protein